MSRAWTPAEPPAPWVPEQWVDEGRIHDEAAAATQRALAKPASRPRRRVKIDDDVAAQIERAAGPRRASRLATMVAEAQDALARERYQDARRLLGPPLAEAPDVAAVRELAGLTYYRLGQWRRAATELEAYRLLSGGAVDRNPVLADCYRALKRYREVDVLWREVREASPSPEIMAETRIVAAGALADQGDLRGALAVMAKAGGQPKKVREHHLREWYVLGDLYDRSGDPVEARRFFARVAEHDRDFADVIERLAALGR